MGDPGAVAERGVLTASDEVWQLAIRRAEVIGRLAAGDAVGHAAADAAAAELGISRRRVYELLRRWRAGSGLVSDLIPGKSSAGRGREQLPEPVEAVIREVLRTRYLTRQRRSMAAVHREIVRTCRSRGLPVPSKGAVVRRAARLDPVTVVAARQGPDAVRARHAAGGVAPAVGLLAQVQMDHTPIDVIVVDERHRLPIGRPYLTVAIDVFSRGIGGMVVTLEAPAALSVGLCLAHLVADKRPWLERLGVQDVLWSASGKPGEIFVDNAAEFRSEALRRGCDQHGITIRWRPPGQPHFGGIVERVIGTLMRLVHELPGTTFSDTRQRGGYASEQLAVLTVTELERWLALAVAVYHGEVHSTLGRTPAGVWAEAAATAPPVTVANATAFLVDFLPVVRRTITRTGFQIDHVQYFCDALKPWIARRERLERFVIRRDPRDISRIWVLDPEGGAYLEVPYRMLSHPPISVWEQKAAVARLREQGRAEVDETALFQMVAQMRAITDTAAKTTRRARRDVARRAATPAPRTPTPPAPPPADGPPGAVAAFDVEEW